MGNGAGSFRIVIITHKLYTLYRPFLPNSGCLQSIQSCWLRLNWLNKPSKILLRSQRLKMHNRNSGLLPKLQQRIQSIQQMWPLDSYKGLKSCKRVQLLGLKGFVELASSWALHVIPSGMMIKHQCFTFSFSMCAALSLLAFGHSTVLF